MEEEFRQKTECTASEAIFNNMKEYSEYTWRSKFPNVIDGLKPVLRRIIISLHNNPAEAKESTVAGRVMEMHPHGDAAISDAIAGLAKPFGNIIPLVDTDGNVGTYTGERPAAARYLVVQHSEAAEDLFYRSTVTSCLRMVPCESEVGVEPANFVPALPTTLLIPLLGIGSAFKTDTCALSVQNLCTLTKEFIRLKYTVPMYEKQLGQLAKYMLPDFTSYCVIRNSKQVVSEYKRGNFNCPFILDGIMEVHKDSIILVSLPYGVSFGKTTHDAGTEITRDAASWLHKHFSEGKDLAGIKSGCDKGRYKFFLRRGENPFEVLSKLKDIVQFSATWTPTRMYFSDDVGLTIETPLTLLEKWADARYKVVLGGLKQKQVDLQEQYRKLEALIKICDHGKEICDIFRKAKHEDETVAILVSKFDLTPYQAKYLQSLPLKQLTARGRQELLDEMQRVKDNIKFLQTRFTKIPDEIVASIDSFEGKYAKKYPAKCTIPKYIGTVCYKNTGYVMIENMKEFDRVVGEFGVDDVKVNLFRGSGDIVVVGTDDSDYNPNYDIPKYIHATYIDKLPFKPVHCSIKLKDGVSFGPLPSVASIIDKNPVPVGKQTCNVIIKHEGRMLVELNQKVLRKTLDVASPSVKDALYVSPLPDDDVIVIHGNTAIPGTLVIDRVCGGRHKLTTSPVGKTIVIGVYAATSEPILFTIPPELSNRALFKHLYIKNVLDIVGKNSNIKVFTTKKRLSNDTRIVQMSSGSPIYKIDK